MLATVVESILGQTGPGRILALVFVLLAIRNRRRGGLPARPVQVAPDRPPAPIESHEWRDGGLQTPAWREADPGFRFEFEKHFSPRNGLYPYSDVRESVYLEFLFTVESRKARSFEDLSRLLLVQFCEGGALNAAPVLNRSGVGCLETYVRCRSRLLHDGPAPQKGGRFESHTGDL